MPACDKDVLNLVRNLQTIFQSGWDVLCFPQRFAVIPVPLPPIPLSPAMVSLLDL